MKVIIREQVNQFQIVEYFQFYLFWIRMKKLFYEKFIMRLLTWWISFFDCENYFIWWIQLKYESLEFESLILLKYSLFLSTKLFSFKWNINLFETIMNSWLSFIFYETCWKNILNRNRICASIRFASSERTIIPFK